eukprot:PhM_4_TR11449/c0_g2_i1/m.63801
MDASDQSAPFSTWKTVPLRSGVGDTASESHQSFMTERSTSTLQSKRMHPRRTLKQQVSDVVSYTPSDLLTPIPTATERFLNSTLECVRTADNSWQCIFDGITTVRRTVLFHPELYKEKYVLHNAVLGLVTCLKSLRSAIAKNALMMAADICTTFSGTKLLDAQYELFVPLVLRIAADGVVLLQQSAHEALHVICQRSRSSSRILSAMLSTFLRGKTSPQLRAVSAQYSAECLWCARDLIRHQKALMKLVYTSLAQWLTDANQDCRTNARTLLSVCIVSDLGDDNELVPPSYDTLPDDVVDNFIVNASRIVDIDTGRSLKEAVRHAHLVRGSSGVRSILRTAKDKELNISNSVSRSASSVSLVAKPHLAVPSPPRPPRTQQPRLPINNNFCIRPMCPPANMQYHTRPPKRRLVMVVAPGESTATSMCPASPRQCAFCQKKDSVISHMFSENYRLSTELDQLKKELAELKASIKP